MITKRESIVIEIIAISWYYKSIIEILRNTLCVERIIRKERTIHNV